MHICFVFCLLEGVCFGFGKFLFCLKMLPVFLFASLAIFCLQTNFSINPLFFVDNALRSVCIFYLKFLITYPFQRYVRVVGNGYL